MGGKAAYFVRISILKSFRSCARSLSAAGNREFGRAAWRRLALWFPYGSGDPRDAHSGTRAGVYPGANQGWSHKKDAIGEDAITEYASHYATPGGMTAGFNFYRALRDDVPFAATLRDQNLTMPVMAIAGQYGVGERLADALRPETRDLESVIAPDCGHFVAEEAPDFFCEHLEKFLVS